MNYRHLTLTIMFLSHGVALACVPVEDLDTSSTSGGSDATGATTGVTSDSTSGATSDSTSGVTTDPTSGVTTDPTSGVTTNTTHSPQCQFDFDCAGCESCIDGSCEEGPGCNHMPECSSDSDCGPGGYCYLDFDYVCGGATELPPCPGQALDLALIDLQGSPAAIVIADLDGDGDMDIAAAHTGVVEVLLGDGAGGLMSGGIFSTGLEDGPLHLAVGDFDLDQEPDLAVLREAPVGELALLFGQDAVFGEPVLLPFGSSPKGLWIGDVDGDGVADLLGANGVKNKVLELRAGDGLGGFGAPTPSPSAFIAVAGAGDLDGDGVLEAAVVGSDQGNWHEIPIVRYVDGPGLEVDEYRSIDGSTPPSALALVDITGDSNAEIISHRELNGVDVLTVLSSGGEAVHYSAAGGMRLGSVGDINGDGLQDLVTFEPLDSGFSVQFSVQGALGCTDSHMSGSGFNPTLLAAGDLDGDGSDDVVAANGTTSLAVLRTGK